MSTFSIGGPRNGLTTSKEIILFQEKLKGERHAEKNSLAHALRPQTVPHSQSTGSLELHDPRSMSSTFSNSHGRTRAISTRPRDKGLRASYIAHLCSGLGSCPPLMRGGAGDTKMIERTAGATMPVRRWE
eukprot:TRINITY_DN43600_c0_g1_i1.p1 TRINITY_DN43600_c0_g1~~TRINITY_DN43600_c0_g1_i1.p1  ORF type:complete len:130 (-),score=15.53 TRINITY_DN43600_c0_g1_i1:30-419(-)